MESPKPTTDNRFKKNHKLPLKSNNVEFLRYCGGHFENGFCPPLGNRYMTVIMPPLWMTTSLRKGCVIGVLGKPYTSLHVFGEYHSPCY